MLSIFTPSFAQGCFFIFAGISDAEEGISRICPIDDSTTYSGPRKPSIVRAFAGDSTITRRGPSLLEASVFLGLRFCSALIVNARARSLAVELSCSDQLSIYVLEYAACVPSRTPPHLIPNVSSVADTCVAAKLVGQT